MGSIPMRMSYFRFLTFGIFGILALVGTPEVQCQQEIPIGEWKSYQPFSKGKWVTQSASRVYYTSDLGILSLDKSDFETTFFTRVDGLSDVEASIVEYDDFSESLVVVYSNSNLDIITSDGIFNLNDILEDNQIVGEKTIHNVSLDGQGNAFLSTTFGLVEIDLTTRTFGFTAFSDLPIYDMAVFEGFYFLSTFDGLYRAPASSQFNHSDFSSWTLVDDIFGLPASFTSITLEVFNDELYVDVDGEVYRISGEMAEQAWDLEGYEIQFLQAGNTHLILGGNCIDPDICNKDEVFFLDTEGNLSDARSCVWATVRAIQDEQGRVFYGDETVDLRYSNSISDACEYIVFNYPLGFSASEIYIDDNIVYIASGGVNNDNWYTFNSNGLQIYDEGKWSYVNDKNTPTLADPIMFDYHRVLVHPFNKKIFVGTFWRGLIEIDGENLNIYDDQNSCLQKYPEEGLRERIGGMAFDRNYNLWLTNNRAPEPFVMFDPEGNCYSFTAGGERDLTQVVVDDNGYKWAAVYSTTSGLVVFDEGELENSGDDRVKILGTGNSALTTNRVNCVEKDLDGDIWVGTDEGVIVFECPGSIFSSGCFGTRRKVDEGGNIAFLLEDEVVKTIAVDGANRKWFGTRNGIFVQSPSGEEKIFQFNTSNSPLPSNEIIDIAVNKETGEVFISTNLGIVSYRTDATHGGLVHSSNVYAFPNPVRPDYDGPIAIRGLPRDAWFKVTDIRGRLVFEGRANGGEAIWDGRDYNGRKASTGVYMVFSSSNDNFNKPDALVTKILFVK